MASVGFPREACRIQDTGAPRLPNETIVQPSLRQRPPIDAPAATHPPPRVHKITPPPRARRFTYPAAAVRTAGAGTLLRPAHRVPRRRLLALGLLLGGAGRGGGGGGLALPAGHLGENERAGCVKQGRDEKQSQEGRSPEERVGRTPENGGSKPTAILVGWWVFSTVRTSRST